MNSGKTQAGGQQHPSKGPSASGKEPQLPKSDIHPQPPPPHEPVYVIFRVTFPSTNAIIARAIRNQQLPAPYYAYLHDQMMQAMQWVDSVWVSSDKYSARQRLGVIIAAWGDSTSPPTPEWDGLDSCQMYLESATPRRLVGMAWIVGPKYVWRNV